MSARTLRRRLAAEGADFRAIQAGVRRRLACAYLTETTLAVADVAGSLGYFDAATFTRAFRAWTGESPRAYRQRRSTM